MSFRPRTTKQTISRRRFLKGAAMATVAGALATRHAMGDSNAAGLAGRWIMKPRPDLLNDESPKGIEVFQLTSEADVPASHIYMEAQIFAPDSKRLIVHRAATAHGPMRSDPRHQYLRCDLDDGGSLHPLTDELRTIAPSVSPDGKYLYYIVDESTLGGGRITLKRVGLDGAGRVTIAVLDTPLADSGLRASRVYPLSTISADGRRLAIAVFLGDGEMDPPPYGLLVFDLQQGNVELALHGPSWCNLHPQSTRNRRARKRRTSIPSCPGMGRWPFSTPTNRVSCRHIWCVWAEAGRYYRPLFGAGKGEGCT